MAKLTLGQKAHRALKLLIGLRNPRIAAALVGHGFTNKDLSEGWALLKALGTSALDGSGGDGGGNYDTSTLQELDQWENKWFPIASAALARHAPDVHAWFFKNLSQTEGPAVIVSVGTFLDRFDKLSKKEADGGPKAGGKAAREKLVERGLTDAVRKSAAELIEKLGGFSGPLPDLPDLEAEDANLAAAEKALWAWYLEWSQIARTSIPQRALLRQLGFLRPASSGAGDEEVDVTDEDPSADPTGAAPAAADNAKEADKKAKKPA